MSALVATVVPWRKQKTPPASTPIGASAPPSPSAIASEGSAVVEETFHTAMRPLFPSNKQTSVKVPPESIPIRNGIYPYHSVRDPLPIIMGHSRWRNQLQVWRKLTPHEAREHPLPRDRGREDVLS